MERGGGEERYVEESGYFLLCLILSSARPSLPLDRFSDFLLLQAAIALQAGVSILIKLSMLIK